MDAASNEQIWSVSDFVAVFNQTIEYAYPNVLISGEIANFKVSKNRWVYFDLKDDESSVRFFGTVYGLPGPLEDGMLVQVRGVPRLHPQFGFSITFQTIQPLGEGSIKRASVLLEAKLAAEGLFDESRKRVLPYPPTRIGLIASSESAAYKDFLKVLSARWGDVSIVLVDVQVQGEIAPAQIVQALERLNAEADLDIIVMTRGGGSPEDMAAFSTESVTRAVGLSRIPTLVAIGHEVDVCLAELAADKRASTPSNAAELLVPDKKQEADRLLSVLERLQQQAVQLVDNKHSALKSTSQRMITYLQHSLQRNQHEVASRAQILEVLNPQAILRRGYATLRKDGVYLRSGKQLKKGDKVLIDMYDASVETIVEQVEVQ